jgi:enediyne biosynthesis thioesterase
VNFLPASVIAVGSSSKRAFVYRHIVSFEETNVVGNVYFTHHIAWFGRCREMFLKQYVPELLRDLLHDLRFVTLRVSCEYFEELHAFDEIEVRMILAHLRQHRIGLEFSIVEVGPRGGFCAALGFQEIGCMRVTDKGFAPIQPPSSLVCALRPYASTSSVKNDANPSKC